jgi:hypothetical protein
MNVVDAMVLLLLAFADICLLVYLRRRRARMLRLDRMSRSLELHIRRQLAPEALLAPRRREFRYLR